MGIVQQILIFQKFQNQSRIVQKISRMSRIVSGGDSKIVQNCPAESSAMSNMVIPESSNMKIPESSGIVQNCPITSPELSNSFWAAAILQIVQKFQNYPRIVHEIKNLQFHYLIVHVQQLLTIFTCK